MINTALFPYSTMPIRLEHQEKQRGTVTCFFQCEEHLEKYIERNSVNRKTSIILRANEQPATPKVNEQPVKPRQTDKKKMVSRPKQASSGGANTSGKLPPNLDSTGNSNQPRKRGRPRKTP